MISISSPGAMTDYRQYAMWLIATIIFLVGFRYAKEAISFVLDKLYQFFIQNHAAPI